MPHTAMLQGFGKPGPSLKKVDMTPDTLPPSGQLNMHDQSFA